MSDEALHGRTEPKVEDSIVVKDAARKYPKAIVEVT
jgi:hypothetical protein